MLIIIDITCHKIQGLNFAQIFINYEFLGKAVFAQFEFGSMSISNLCY